MTAAEEHTQHTHAYAEVSHLSLLTNGCEGNVGIVKGVADNPPPFAGEAATPVLF